MASWAGLGHGIRRRQGAPTSHLGSAGDSMARNIPTSDEAHAAHGAAGSAKIPVGAAPALQGTLRPRGASAKSSDPTIADKGNRKGIERVGASYRINGHIAAPIDPAAGATMRSARIVPSVAGRVNPNFDSARGSSY